MADVRVESLFPRVLGQEIIKRRLYHALKENALSHAYLLTGPAGLGKETMVREFAAAILCDQAETYCGVCTSCKQVNAGTHPELRWIIPDDPEKDTSLSVELVRATIKEIYLKPYTGQWKVYGIPKANRLTPQAQNALLKTLEEPPDHAVIIMTAEQPQQLLPTVLSRCQRLDFRPVSMESIRDWLVREGKASGDRSVTAAAYAHGVPSRALQLLEDPVFQEIRKQWLNTTETCMTGDLSAFLESAEKLTQEKASTLALLDFWQEWLRDLLVVKIAGEPELLIHMDQIERLEEQGKRVELKSLTTGLRLLEDARNDLLNHGNPGYVTEVALVNLMNQLLSLNGLRSV